MLDERIERIEKRNSTTWIYVSGSNKKSETMIIEICHCEANPKDKKTLPYLWFQAGMTKKLYKTWISCQTYVNDSEGDCNGIYNPTVIKGKTKIDFDWLLEDTEENREKIINKCIEVFFAAEGKSATEIKEEKINKYAEEKGLKVYKELPEGWQIYHIVDCPVGCDRIANMHPFRERKNPNLEVGLLVI